MASEAAELRRRVTALGRRTRGAHSRRSTRPAQTTWCKVAQNSRPPRTSPHRSPRSPSRRSSLARSAS